MQASPLSAQAVLHIKGGLALLLGLGIVAIALQGLLRGELPMGRGGRQRTVLRAEQPLLFWTAFALEVFLGVVCIRAALAWM